MIGALFADAAVKVLLVFVLISAAFIITIRDLLSLVTIYAVQSALLAAIAGVLYLSGGSALLVYLALLTLASKVFIIPSVIRRVQKSINIKRDAQFHYLSPTGSIFASMLVILLVYYSFSRVFGEFAASRLLFLGAVIGVSLTFMGMMVIFSRKKTITNIIGYLTMENGVLLFGLFLAEIPLIIEALIIVDLVIITLLAAILAFGIDSPIEEFHARLNPFREKAEEETL